MVGMVRLGGRAFLLRHAPPYHLRRVPAGARARPSCNRQPHYPGAFFHRHSRRGPPRVLSNVPARPEFPSLPAEAVLAFIKQASIEPTFDAVYAARSLKLTSTEARQLLAVLLAAGYVEQVSGNRYRTTESGDAAAGAKPPGSAARMWLRRFPHWSEAC